MSTAIILAFCFPCNGSGIEWKTCGNDTVDVIIVFAGIICVMM